MIPITGKREEKKTILREKILTAAREIFMTQGYETTTIGQIAAKADVGLGTAYNFFKSKEELFLLAMAEEMAGIGDKEKEIQSDGVFPADIITNMVLTSIRRLNFFGKKIWRVAMAAIFSSMKSNNMVMNELMKGIKGGDSYHEH